MAVKVKRERPDQRRHHRVTAPLWVVVDGHRVRAADWSLGGLRIEAFPGDLPPVGSDVELHLTLPFQGFDVSFDAKAEVVRADVECGMFATVFTQLGERERELMSHFLEELVRGSMVDVEDTIQRIDVPVTPASLEPDKAPSLSHVPVRRWPMKAIMMTGLYAVIGLFVFGYTALLGYTNFYRMEVQTAVISAPVETVTAQADGRVEWTRLQPGDTVKSGDVILNVVDNLLEKEIELADITINERKAQLVFMKRRQANEFERMKGFASVESKNVEQAKLDVDGLRAQLTAAEQLYGRVVILHKKGFATDSKLEEAEKQIATLKATLESRQVELKSRAELAVNLGGKYHYTGQNMVGDVDQIEAQIRLAEHEVMIAQQKQSALANHRNRLSVRAPFEGTILEIPHVDRGAVKRGDVIAIMEQRRQREVTAFLNQEEVNRVGLGDEALLFVPALGETLKGRIQRIDRTTAFVREQNQAQAPGYRWRGPTDRTAKVTIGFADPAKVQDADKYRSGLPVVVVFPQRATSPPLGAMRSKSTSM
jgi:multidrug resistance efflux pump